MPDFMQDLKLKLDPAFMPPEADKKGPLPPLVPPLRLGGQPGAGFGAGYDPTAGQLPPNLLPQVPMAPPEGQPDLFSGYADGPSGGTGPTAMQAISGAVEGLGTRPGVQVDKNGIGTTLDDWKLRFMPYIPFLNEP
jgi:hypothetical protein